MEGLALAGGVLYASGQNVATPRFNWYSRYDAASGAYLGSFRISGTQNFKYASVNLVDGSP